jgi:asparagine synthase (glutamine-hydrolysing)
VAAGLLLKENKELHGYTSVPRYPENAKVNTGSLADEFPLAELLAKNFTNLQHHPVYSDDISVMEGITKSLDMHLQPVRNVTNQSWIHSLLLQAVGDGNRILLTGQGGNLTTSWPFRGYFQHRMAPGPRKYISELLPDNIKYAFLRYQKGAEPYLHYSFLLPSFALQTQLLQSMKKAGYDPYFLLFKSLRKMREKVFKTTLVHGDSLWQEKGELYGIQVYDPTFDFRLMEFCLAIPDEQFIRKGHDRYLIKRMMRDTLPAEILELKKKGKQSSDIVSRIRNEQTFIKNLLEEIKMQAFYKQRIDMQKFYCAFENICNQNGKRFYEAAFLRTIMLILFYKSNGR